MHIPFIPDHAIMRSRAIFDRAIVVMDEAFSGKSALLYDIAVRYIEENPEARVGILCETDTVKKMVGHSVYLVPNHLDFNSAPEFDTIITDEVSLPVRYFDKRWLAVAVTKSVNRSIAADMFGLSVLGVRSSLNLHKIRRAFKPLSNKEF